MIDLPAFSYPYFGVADGEILTCCLLQLYLTFHSTIVLIDDSHCTIGNYLSLIHI